MSVVLSAHKGAKVVLSLCVCRMPSRYVEPEFAKRYRLWKEEWESRKDFRLNIADGLAYLKTPGHFLPSIEERQRRLAQSAGSSPTGDTKQHLSEIDELLSEEGIPELSNMTTKTDGMKKLQTAGSDEMKIQQASLDSDSMMYLIVKYRENPDVWTLPFANRVNTDSAEKTLNRICSKQLGIKPHFPSLAPTAFRKIPGEPPSRLFYYKGIFVPKTPEVRISADSGIVAHEWVPRNELEKRLSVGAWKTLRDTLPLD